MGIPLRVQDVLLNEHISVLRLSEPARVSAGATLFETIRLMRQAHIGCALVMEGNRTVGILTERDVLNRIVGASVDLHSPVSEFMTPKPQTLRPEDTLGRAAQMMTETGYRHVPLVDREGKDAGVVCAKDLVEYIAEHFPAEVVNLPPRLHQVMRRPEGG
jgi:CBS domain-containing protein